MSKEPDVQTPPIEKALISYGDYLASPEWKAKCELVLVRDGHECRTCPSHEDLEVHHRTYVRLGHEYLEDLIILCRECHEAITNSIRERSYEKQEHQPGKDERITPLREDLREAIGIIVETAMQEYRFDIVNATTLRMIENDLRKALAIREPRIDVLEVTTGMDNGRLKIEIDYRDRSNNFRFKLGHLFCYNRD